MTEPVVDTQTKVISDEELQKKLWALFGKPREPDLTRNSTALLCVDIQYVDAHRDYGLGAKAKNLGIADFLDYYWDRVENVVIPNVQRLQATARSKPESTDGQGWTARGQRKGVRELQAR